MAKVSIQQRLEEIRRVPSRQGPQHRMCRRLVPQSILGPSGCGKSSTMRMIAGLEHITAGDIFFDEQRINDLAPKDRDVAMVFENYALYPHKSVFENMANPLKLRGQDAARIKERVTAGRQVCSRSANLLASPPAGTVRRPETARGDRPRHRARTQALPVRRAHCPSRRQACAPICAARSSICSARSAPP